MISAIFRCIAISLCWGSLSYAASNPELTVEWFPNNEHPNPAREGKLVYPLTINGVRGAETVGVRVFVWSYGFQQVFPVHHCAIARIRGVKKFSISSLTHLMFHNVQAFAMPISIPLVDIAKRRIDSIGTLPSPLSGEQEQFIRSVWSGGSVSNLSHYAISQVPILA